MDNHQVFLWMHYQENNSMDKVLTEKVDAGPRQLLRQFQLMFDQTHVSDIFHGPLKRVIKILNMKQVTES